jgi:hypothetical protein
MSRKIKSARLHDSIAIPSEPVVQFKKTLDNRTYPGLIMTLGMQGVYVEYKGHVALIPVTNFEAIVLEPNTK